MTFRGFELFLYLPVDNCQRDAHVTKKENCNLFEWWFFNLVDILLKMKALSENILVYFSTISKVNMI